MKRIENIFNKYAEERSFTGVGLIKKGEEVIFHKAYGHANKGWKIDNTIHTKFDTASITKTFTAVGIMQLVEKGLISLNDRVLELIDIGETAISKDVTIYHCLTHTSGIGDDADEEAGESYEAIWLDKPNYSVRETVDYLPQFKHKEGNFKPGEGCRYNNCAFILLALVIEKVSGKKYHEYIKENIFDVVGMKNTGFYAMDEVVEGVAECYGAIEDEDENIIGWKKNIYSYPVIGSGDAGALTNPEDLDLFIRAIYDGKLLNKENTDAITTPKELYRECETENHMMGFAFEFDIDKEDNKILLVEKDGINTGVACIMRYYPSNDITMIIMANQDCNVWALRNELHDIVKQINRMVI